MARPKKTGLDYFPFDVDYFDDFKITDLLNEYGPLGTTIYEVIISKVYKNGYYLQIPLDKLAAQIVRIIGNRWVKNKNLVLQVIQYCADIGLFDNALLSQSVITSVGIQRRYSEVTARNKVDKSKYWLLEENNCQAALESAPEKRVSATETPENVTETKVTATSIPQKESKVNKRKLNESKEKNTSTCVDSLSRIDYRKVVDLFNSICGGKLPEVKSLTEKRERAIKLAYQQLNGDFEGYFKRISDSDFLTGKNKKKWKASFDWILEQSNLVKVTEGNYDAVKAEDNGRHSSFDNSEVEELIRSLDGVCV